MTIFLTVLKLLIKDQLKNLIDVQEGKMVSVVPFFNYTPYNKDLSKDQKEAIGALQDKIIRFDGTGNDKADLQLVLKMIDESRKQIQKLREAHKESRDGGETVTGYNNLRNHCIAFYDKLKDINNLKSEKKPLIAKDIEISDEAQPIEEMEKSTDFQFMDRPFKYTPENIVYYHAAIYYGDEIFNPQNIGSKDLRVQKELALLERIIQLSEWIKPTYNLAEQRTRVLKVLKDLGGDNLRITQGPTGKGVSPSISLLGGLANVSVEKLFSPGEGRFGQEFNQAVRAVNNMTSEQFGKLNTDSEKELLVKQEGKSQPKATPKSQDKVEPKTKAFSLFAKSPPKPKPLTKAVEDEEEIAVEEEEVLTKRPKAKVPPKPHLKAQEPEEEKDAEEVLAKQDVGEGNKSDAENEEEQQIENEEERGLEHSM
ncbi:hypothetical protein [Legionella waltersii]|uniref:Coiled coil protein n=1 Tax=Legionella waltersii TaxID=66969 RepID=A0A0W1A4W6_9GAMM|nr:hypothetical protein [Legionella waltersii]KTD76379.1 hypothetical protein Lwal_2101 [Legionella waltersii]SNV14065.1 Uncharacterised protein [Legionella waltersii]